MPSTSLTPADIKILKQLQHSGRMTNQELADKVGMATSPCWRRVKQLEESGIITGYQANIDRRKVGLGILAFIRVKIDSHSEEESKLFEMQVGALKPVIACYAVAGDADFYCKWSPTISTVFPPLRCQSFVGYRALKRCKRHSCCAR